MPVNPFRFVGQQGYYYDSALTQYYVRARHYNPIQARWLSQDPLRGLVGPNLYSYVQNNPILLTDPSGLLSDCARAQIEFLVYTVGLYASYVTCGSIIFIALTAAVPTAGFSLAALLAAVGFCGACLGFVLREAFPCAGGGKTWDEFEISVANECRGL